MWENTDCNISYPCHRRSSVIDSGSIAEEESQLSVVVGKRSQQGLSKQQVAWLQLSKTQMEVLFCVLFERRPTSHGNLSNSRQNNSVSTVKSCQIAIPKQKIRDPVLVEGMMTKMHVMLCRQPTFSYATAYSVKFSLALLDSISDILLKCTIVYGSCVGFNKHQWSNEKEH